MKHLNFAMLVMVMVMAAHAETTPMQLGCNGQMIEPIAKAASPRTIQLTISADKVGVDNAAAQIESNNTIQLKFKTAEFVGEYFHYTGDLFLIYRSGHLARLTCKQN
jgi:hypothetical protein